MKIINFAKMHGLGNDFVIVQKSDIIAGYNLNDLIINIANRRTGIGCDQIIIYNKLQSVTNIDYEMLIYNIDGSKATLCGNASRCLAMLIYLNTGSKYSNLVTETKNIKCEILNNDLVSVNIGEACFDKSWMPKIDDILPVLSRYNIDPKDAISVDVGNPHIVIFKTLSLEDKQVIGEIFQDTKLFKDGVNVNFAEIILENENNNDDVNIRLQVWERGVGFTLACGSGACATYAASLKLGYVQKPSHILFEKGYLDMSVHENNIIMTGDSNLVAIGEYYIKSI